MVVAPMMVERTKSLSRTNRKDKSVSVVPLSRAKVWYSVRQSFKRGSLNRDMYPGKSVNRLFFGGSSLFKYFPVNAPPANGEYAKKLTSWFFGEHASFKSVSNAILWSKLYPF